MADSYCTCAQCGAPFIRSGKRKYCNKTCKSRADEARRKASPEVMAHRAETQRARRANESAEQRAARQAACRDYVQRNRDAVLATKRAYYLENADRLRAANKARYESAPEVRKAYQERARSWRELNREKKVAANKRWAAENRDKALRYYRKSKALRRQNPSHRLYAAIGAQIRTALNGGKGGRRWESLVGYSRDDLIKHLERQFVGGMTWANYGTAWHVDHIVPQVTFEFDRIESEAVRACWALSNLRPLAAVANLSKGAKVLHLL